jgi:hypothetical protein
LANVTIHLESISSLWVILITLFTFIIILLFIYFINYFFKNVIKWGSALK